MDITMRYEEDVLVLELKGRLTIGDGDVVLRETLTELLDEGSKKFVIDLGGVKIVDSSGLGELLRFRGLAQEQDAEIKLVHVDTGVRDVLEMTRLIGVFDIYEHELEAVASFRGGTPEPD